MRNFLTLLSMLIHHHRYPRQRGGSNDNVNLQLVQREQEQKMHWFFSNDITHEKLYRILNWDSPIINPDVITGIERIIQEAGMDMYNKKAYKSNHWPVSFVRKNGLYVPHS